MQERPGGAVTRSLSSGGFGSLRSNPCRESASRRPSNAAPRPTRWSRPVGSATGRRRLTSSNRTTALSGEKRHRAGWVLCALGARLASRTSWSWRSRGSALTGPRPSLCGTGAAAAAGGHRAAPSASGSPGSRRRSTSRRKRPAPCTSSSRSSGGPRGTAGPTIPSWNGQERSWISNTELRGWRARCH